MSHHSDVAIIGGGIIGLTSALSLAQAGLTVEVLDQADLGREASWAGAGIIPPGCFDRAVTPIDKLRAFGSEQFPIFSQTLFEDTGIDNGYRGCGGIEFLEPADEYVLPLWAAEDITVIPIGVPRLKQIEPAVANVSGRAFLLPQYAQVRNPWHLRGLIAACERLGVKLLPHHHVREFRNDCGKTRALILQNGEERKAEQFLIAAGAWSGRFIPESRIHPVRGQIILFNPGRQVLTHVLMAGKRYLVPRGDGRVLVGSTEEPEAGFEKANTSIAIAELRAFAIEMVPDLADAPVEKCWSGLRPGTRDGLPFIAPVPHLENGFLAAGHFRAGVQLSLGTARFIVELMTNRPTIVDPAAFRLDRDPEANSKPAFRS